MKILNFVTQPHYVFRPGQILRRLRFSWRETKDCISTVGLPWRLIIRCRPNEELGYSLHTAGVYDLVLTEAICRMIGLGEIAVDVGANIGYATGLLAKLTGPQGKVYAFEPHPRIFTELKTNVDHWVQDRAVAPIEVFQLASSDKEGSGQLYEPEGFETNNGLASLVSTVGITGTVHSVATLRLDALVPVKESKIGILKVDVEGQELAVFKGAELLLRSKGIRNILFEEFLPYPAATHDFLKHFDYTIFHVQQHLFGPRLCLTEPGYLPPKDNPPNYLATLDPVQAVARFRPRGWVCLTGFEK